MSKPYHFYLPRPFYHEMLIQAQTEYPNECCGLLAGIVDADQQALRAMAHYPLVNEAASTVEYYSAFSLLQASKDMRALNYEIVAVYHSHPISAPVPSRTDLERSEFYTEVVHFIISLQGPNPQMCGWWLAPEKYEEAIWKLTEG